MRRPIGRALLWLVIPALAFRALTVLHLDLRGPLHFHVDWLHHDHDDDEDDRHVHAHEEDAAPGWSATMCVALVSADAWPAPSLLRDFVAPPGHTHFQTRFLGRLERPPPPAPA